MLNLKDLIRAHRQNTGRRDRRVARIAPTRPSYKVELWYKAQLLAIVKQLRSATEQILFPILKETESQYSYTKDAAYADRIASGIESLSKRFGGIQNTANRLAQLAIEKARGEVDDKLKTSIRSAIGIDIGPVLNSGSIADEIASLTWANVNLITSIPNQYFDKVATSVYNNTSQGMRYEDIISDIQRIGEVTVNRAKLIARDQTAKMNASITEARQTSLGIDKYTWRTAGDERVRETHAANEDQVFSWNDPPSETGHPGHDINCRCVAEPYIDLDEEEKQLGLTETEEE